MGRNEKRRIRAWVHRFVTNRLDTDQITKLRGMLNYVNSLDQGRVGAGSEEQARHQVAAELGKALQVELAHDDFDAAMADLARQSPQIRYEVLLRITQSFSQRPVVASVSWLTKD